MQIVCTAYSAKYSDCRIVLDTDIYQIGMMRLTKNGTQNEYIKEQYKKGLL